MVTGVVLDVLFLIGLFGTINVKVIDNGRVGPEAHVHVVSFHVVCSGSRVDLGYAAGRVGEPSRMGVTAICYPHLSPGERAGGQQGWDVVGFS